MRKLTVKKYQAGFGITDGKLWFSYYYETMAKAEQVKTNILRDAALIPQNVNRDTPLILVKE